MAYSTPAQTTGSATTSGVTSSSLSFTNPTTAGNLVVVAISFGVNGSGLTVSVSDNKGNTYSQAALSGESSTNDDSAIFYSILGTGGSGHQVTVTPSVSSFTTISLSEWAGGASSAILEAATGQVTNNSTTISSGSITPGTNNDLLIGVMNDDTSQTGVTDPAGFSTIYSNDANTIEAIHSNYKVQSGGAGTPVSATWTVPASDHGSACIAAFKPGSGGSTPLTWNMTDSAAGSDSVTSSRSLPLTDSATGTHTATIASTLSSTDSAAGSDAISLAVVFATQSDSATGTDSASTNRILSLTDTTAGTDGASLAATWLPSDSALGAESISTASTWTASDSAVGTEGPVSFGQLISWVMSDSAAGSDSIAWAATWRPSDSAAGSETVSSAAKITAADSGLGSDTLTLAVVFATQSDSAAGSDSASVASTLLPADSALGSESPSFTPTWLPADAALGAEGVILASAWSFADSATGSEHNVSFGVPENVPSTLTCTVIVAAGMPDPSRTAVKNI